MLPQSLADTAPLSEAEMEALLADPLYPVVL